MDPASFETGCSGIQLALPAPTFRSDGMSAMQGMEQPALTCDDVVVTMTSDGLRISFVDGALKLCPGCFLVGGPDNVMASWRTLDGSDASLIPIGPPAMPYCGAGPDMSLTAEVGPVTPCNAEENAELDGEVLNGGTFLTSSAGVLPGVSGEPRMQRLDVLHRRGRMRRSRADVQLQSMQSQVPGPRAAVPWTRTGEARPGDHVHVREPS